MDEKKNRFGSGDRDDEQPRAVVRELKNFCISVVISIRVSQKIYLTQQFLGIGTFHVGHFIMIFSISLRLLERPPC